MFSNVDAPNQSQRVRISWEMLKQDDPHGWDFKELSGKRKKSFERGDWRYIGIVARARVFIPIGQGSFRVLALDSAGLWGIESDSGQYLREVYEEERENLLAELRTLGAALAAGDYIERPAEHG